MGGKERRPAVYDRPKPDVNLFIDPVRVPRCCGAALIRATPRKQAFVSFIPLNFADIAAISGTAFDTRGPMIHLPLLLLPSSFPFPSLPPWELGQARRLDRSPSLAKQRKPRNYCQCIFTSFFREFVGNNNINNN